MNHWEIVRNFFNSKVSNKIFTRAEYFSYIRNQQKNKKLRRNAITATSVDTYRLLLMRAGFLRQEEPGVYRKIRKIPDNLSYTQARNLAYPKSGLHE